MYSYIPGCGAKSEGNSISFQEFSPSELRRTCLIPPAMNCDRMGEMRSLETLCSVFSLGAACIGTLFLVVPKFQTPEVEQKNISINCIVCTSS